MTRQNGPWSIHDVRTGYENPWIRVDHHEVTCPDGAAGIYGVVRFANLAIGVLPLFEDGTTMLVGQHRFTFDEYSWELPEGGGPKGEAPEETARRELAEETGITAGELAPLGEAQLSNSVSDEYSHYFLAWDLTLGEASPDPDEVLEQRRVSFAELVGEIISGRILDSLTILMVQGAILKAQLGLLPNAPASIILDELKRVEGFRQPKE